MTNCDDCRRARTGTWSIYRATCQGCKARGVARSMATFTAVREKDPKALQAMLARVFPALPYEQARRLVWDWWLIDHPEQGQKTR